MIKPIKSVQVFWVYWEFSRRLDRKPSCLQERRETRYFCHGLWGFLAEVWHTTQPGTSDTAWHCETKPWKELTVCCNEAQRVPLATLPLFRRRLWPTITIYTLRPIQRQWTSPTSHLLICLGHEHAQKATGPVFWISLPSRCGAPWFPVKRWVKKENNPWLHGPNQNMTKYRIDANTHDPPCTSSSALKRETSEVDFRCSWHTPLLQEDYNWL